MFEESIVDFFETADANKDGIVDYNDFYSVRELYCHIRAHTPTHTPTHPHTHTHTHTHTHINSYSFLQW